jgi:predicted enzyme related to lactoylglutathione lyase
MPEIRWNPRSAGVLAAALLLPLLATGTHAADRYWPPIVDPATGQYTPGRWVWGDLVTSDVARAADFYGKVFGWTYETYGCKDDRDTYTLVLADGLPIGGMVFDPRTMQGDVPSARWIGMISVPDVRATAAAVTQGGGQVVLEPKMLGQRGETAVFRDPEGVLFGAVHSKNGDPADYFGDLNEWVWLDLWTSDVDRAAAFYRSVAGYEVLPLPEESTRTGVRLASGGYVRAGIMQKRDARDSAVWLPYVRVSDAKAAADRARAAGGAVLFEPVSLGRAVVAIIADPTGAPVGVAQLHDQEAQR